MELPTSAPDSQTARPAAASRRLRVTVFSGLVALLVVQGVVLLRSTWHHAHDAAAGNSGSAAQPPRHHRPEVRLHGEHLAQAQHRTRHGMANIAILTLRQRPSGREGPSNVAEYAKKWAYPVIEASKSVKQAARVLRTAGADPSFLRAFAILRHLPRYDWVFWHDADSLFLNFSRPLDEFVDDRYDMVLTAGPCGSGKLEKTVNAGHMLIKNGPGAIANWRAIWGLWNHTSCKYGENQLHHGQPLCKLKDGRPMYANGDQGALMSLLQHCPECERKVKYTGFRTFNSLYPCHGPGDLVVHVPGASSDTRQRVLGEFLEHTDFSTGVFDASANPKLAPACRSTQDHDCNTRATCDKKYRALNLHRRCSSGREEHRSAGAVAGEPSAQHGTLEVGSTRSHQQDDGSQSVSVR